MKTAAIRVHELGGPEQLILEQVDVASPKDNEVVIKQTAIGLNFIDTYFRSGFILRSSHPIGMEAAGVIEKLGPGVTEFKAGDRVAYASAPLGSYSIADISYTKSS